MKARIKVFSDVSVRHNYSIGQEVEVEPISKNTYRCVDKWFWFYKDDLEFIEELKEDPIVNQVIDKFKERSEKGIQTYGTTLHDNNTDDFLNHLQEELMDAVLYI